MVLHFDEVNMKHLKTSTKVIIFGSAFLILLTVFFSFLNYNMHTYLDSDEEYKQNWYCKEYNFSFSSYGKNFPEASGDQCKNATINNHKVDVMVEYDCFYIGKYYTVTENGKKYTDFKSYASASSYDYSWGKLTVKIDKVENKKYNYLKGKTLIFKKNK